MSSGGKSKEPDGALPKLTVARKKRRRPTSQAIRPTTTTKATKGLPSFPIKSTRSATGRATLRQQYDSSNDDEPTEDDDDDVFVDSTGLEWSDTWQAVQSLLTTSQGLHIPLLCNGQSVQAVLECQLFSKFQVDHASVINRELRDLVDANQLRRLPCQGNSGTTTMALIRTVDYTAGVWDAFSHHHPESTATDNNRLTIITSWFVDRVLPAITSRSLSRNSLKELWEEKEFPSTDSKGISVKERTSSFDSVLQMLLKIQVLIRNASSNNGALVGKDSYYLWLPQWGRVLQSWSEARQKLLVRVPKEKGEISERNILRENRHAAVSTKFVLDDLVQQGILVVVQRPFGTFLQRGGVTSKT